METVYLVAMSASSCTVDRHSTKAFRNKEDAHEYLTIDMGLSHCGEIDDYSLYIWGENHKVMYYMWPANVREPGDRDETTE